MPTCTRRAVRKRRPNGRPAHPDDRPLKTAAAPFGRSAGRSRTQSLTPGPIGRAGGRGQGRRWPVAAAAAETPVRPPSHCRLIAGAGFCRASLPELLDAGVMTDKLEPFTLTLLDGPPWDFRMAARADGQIVVAQAGHRS